MFHYLKNRLLSFKWAIKGLIDLFRNHPNAQIHLLATILVFVLSWYFQISAVEFGLVLLCIGLVIAMEAVNSAIEYLCDKVSEEHHELIGKAKDIAAGAVLICAIVAVGVGALVFLPKVWG